MNTGEWISAKRGEPAHHLLLAERSVATRVIVEELSVLWCPPFMLTKSLVLARMLYFRFCSIFLYARSFSKYLLFYLATHSVSKQSSGARLRYSLTTMVEFIPLDSFHHHVGNFRCCASIIISWCFRAQRAARR